MPGFLSAWLKHAKDRFQRIAGTHLPTQYRRRLERFRYGAGAFKIDYALREAIPWIAPEYSRAATVHIGGSLEEIVESERNFTSDRPFVLLGQPPMFDPTRAPVGQHTAWAATYQTEARTTTPN